MIETAYELRRHERGARRTSLRDKRRKSLGIEAAQDHRRTGEQVRHEDDLRDRPKRADIEKHRIAGDVEALRGSNRDRKKVAVLQHDGLRRPRRAAAEIERGERLAIDRRKRPFGGSIEQRLVVETRAAADGNDVAQALDLTPQSIERIGKRRMDDQRAGAGMPQQRDDVRAGQPRVERHPHEARSHNAVVRFEIFADVGHEQRDAVAAAQPQPAQRVAETRDARMKLPIGPAAGGVDDGDAVGVQCCELA